MLVAAALFAALPASDNFNRANGGLGTNWTDIQAGLMILSNAAGTSGVAATSETAYWNADAFPNDQYAQITLNASPAVGNYIGPVVRAVGTSFYRVLWNPGDSCYVQRFNSGSLTATLTFFGLAAGAGDIIKLTAVGGSSTVLTVYKNGVAVGTVTDSSGSVILSGSGGISGSAGPLATAYIDAWEGGAVAGAAVARRGVIVQ